MPSSTWSSPAGLTSPPRTTRPRNRPEHHRDPAVGRSEAGWGVGLHRQPQRGAARHDLRGHRLQRLELRMPAAGHECGRRQRLRRETVNSNSGSVTPTGNHLLDEPLPTLVWRRPAATPRRIRHHREPLVCFRNRRHSPGDVLAVSNDSNPLDGSHRYHVPTAAPVTSRLPKLGYNADAIVIELQRLWSATGILLTPRSRRSTRPRSCQEHLVQHVASRPEFRA